MDIVEDDQINSKFTWEELLNLFCNYEAEIQAKDVIIEFLLNKFTSSSSLTQQEQPFLPTTTISTSNPLKSLIKDSIYFDSNNLNNFCNNCNNNILTIAKFIKSKKDANINIDKCLNLMSKQFLKNIDELNEKHKQILNISKIEENYLKNLEIERNELFEQLKSCQNELNKLEEEKTKIEQKYFDECEREKLLILFLLEERGKLLKEIEEIKINKTSTESSSCSSTNLKNNLNSSTNMKLFYLNLEEENKQLNKSIKQINSEKLILQKRLDFLLKDLQQNEFQKQFNFLQPRGSSISEKELILIGNNFNNKINSKIIPPHQINDSTSTKIKNSSSFPQSFDFKKQQNSQQNLSSLRPPIDKRKNLNSCTASTSCSTPSTSCTPTTSSVVPLLIGHSTTLINKSTQPKTNAFNQNYHHYRTQNNNTGTFEQMKKYQQQPQTVICRRSTSLPRRIISSAAIQQQQQSSFPTIPNDYQHQQQRNNNNDFYHHQKPPLMGTINYTNTKHL